MSECPILYVFLIAQFCFDPTGNESITAGIKCWHNEPVKCVQS